MATVNEIRQAQRAVGPATVLAIGMANPLNCFDQSTYPDYYFRVTNSDDKIELKQNFKRMCDGSMIKKRYSYLTDKILKKNRNFYQYKAPSLDARQEIAIVEVPKLGKEAAEKAINEWGQSKSMITHLVFCTTSGVDIPGADYQLTQLLELDLSVKGFMMYQQGCSGGATILRLAKDLAENNKGARVLVVCSELINFLDFHAPSETETEVLVGLYLQLKTLLPDSGYEITAKLGEAGLIAKIHKNTPMLISKNIERILGEAFQPLGISNT
ncbi:hypothetical protein H5410_063591 [Solanum commersonii]|uniref:chalcone synthase n=1 Tax=Solanum commersonii TaxID=4109 RepID=A0A9J5WDN6_SOLCO|nr:hypothetical protein H5410_063591 [Solanum commersonii]